MIKYRVMIETDFYVDGKAKDYSREDIKQVIIRNINGWQYHGADVFVDMLPVEVKWQEISAGANRIYQEDIKRVK